MIIFTIIIMPSCHHHEGGIITTIKENDGDGYR
jgi:hypothetical protein